MGRLAPLLALMLVSLVPLAACETPVGCPEVAEMFALTMPNGATELVPGSSVRLTWDPIAGTSAVVAFILVEGDQRIPTGTVAASAGVHEFSTADNDAAIPPGVYRIQGVFGGCALSDPPYDGGPLRLVYAQGVRFADTSLTITGAETPRNVAYTTVSLSTIDLEMLADATPDTPGDEILLGEVSVPGELVAMTRQFAFTGRTSTNAALPGGQYRLVARVHARNDTVTYDAPGPTITWTP